MSAYTPWDPDSIGRAIDNGEIKRGKALAEFVSTPAKVNAPAMFDTEDLVEVRLGALLSDEYRQLVASIVREKFPAATVLQARLAEHLYTLNFDPAP